MLDSNNFLSTFVFFFNNSIDVWPAERPPGYDRVRNAEIGNKDFELDVLEEAYTTEHWLVRIYKVPWLFPFLLLVQCGASISVVTFNPCIPL